MRGAARLAVVTLVAPGSLVNQDAKFIRIAAPPTAVANKSWTGAAFIAGSATLIANA